METNMLDELLRMAEQQELEEWANAAGLAWCLAKFVPNGEFTLDKDEYLKEFQRGGIKRYLHGRWNDDFTSIVLHLDSVRNHCDRDETARPN